MRSFKKIVVAMLAFSFGSSIVSLAEDVVCRIELGHVEPVIEQSFNIDRNIAVDTLTKPFDFHLKGVRLGSTERAVIKAFGKPNRKERSSPDTDLFIYRYNGAELVLFEYEGIKTVDSIEITGTSFSFEGLTVGSTLEEVRFQLGRELYEEGDGMFYYNSISDNAYITINHDGTKVTSIIAAYAGC